MFDLKPRVDFKEVDRVNAPHFVDKEFDSACALIADGASESHRTVTDRLARFRCYAGRRRFLDDLLIPPLNRALALTQVDDIAIGIADDLDLDVTSSINEWFDEDRAVAKRRGSLPRPGCDGVGEFVGTTNHTHAAATTTSRRFNKGRHRDTGGDLYCASGSCHDLKQWCGWDVGLDGEPLCSDLVAKSPNLIRGRAHPDQSSRHNALSDVGILREESIAGVKSIAAMAQRYLDDLIGAQVRLCGRRAAQRNGNVDCVGMHCIGVWFGEHPNRRDAEPMRCARDAHHNFTAVRNHQLRDRASR